MLPVVVVGGEPSFIQGRFKDNLAGIGVDVQWHWDWDEKARDFKVPAAAKGIIVVKDMVGHSQRNRAVAMAKRKALPFADIPSKFAQARRTLIAKGFLKPSEVTQVEVSSQRPPFVLKSVSFVDENLDPLDEFQDAVWMLLEETPELSDRELHDQLTQLLGFTNTAFPVQKVRDDLRQSWASTSPAPPEVFAKKLQFLKRFIAKYYRETGTLPGQRAANLASTEFFGTGIEWNRFKKLRDEVMETFQAPQLEEETVLTLTPLEEGVSQLTVSVGVWVESLRDLSSEVAFVSQQLQEVLAAFERGGA